MEILEVHTVNGADIFLAYFPDVRGKKQYYASYTAAGNVPALVWEPDKDRPYHYERGYRVTDRPTMENLLFDSLLSEHAARVRLKKLIAAAPFVTFTRSDKSIHKTHQ